MGTILKIKKRFISIRWKLVFTYLILIILTLGLMLNFVISSIEEKRIEDNRDFLFTQANILSNQIITEFHNLSHTHTNSYYLEIVSDFAKEIDSRIIIFNENKIVLIDSFNEYNLNSDINNMELEKSLLGNQDSNVYKFKDIGRVIYVSVPVKSQTDVIGSILIISSLEPIYDGLKDLSNSLFFLAIICIGVTGVTSFIFAEIISSPIEKVTELVNRISYGKYDEKLEVEGNDEIKVLSNSFNSMMVKLNQVDTQRKRFVSNVSHELRTPLTSIKLLSSSLITDELTDPKIYKEFLEDIDGEVDRLNEIIDSLLYLVDLEKKELELNYTNNYVNIFLKKIVYMFQPLAKQKEITIDLICDDNVWAYYDKPKIYQCIFNLIENSIKYNNIKGNVIVKLINSKNSFIITIEDNGYGIKEESLPFVFDRFYRADKVRNRKLGGTGLGLSIVKQIVNIHQGIISIESVYNEGTIISIELPKNIS